VNPLLQILQQALVDNLAPKKSDLLQRGAIGVFVVALTVALSFIALVFLAVAFYSWMTLSIAPPLAALATAGSALVMCLIAMAITYVALKPEQDIPSQPDTDQITEIMSTVASMAGEEFGKTAESNPKTTLLLAGIAGLVAGKYLK